jgi:arabinose-5-phosphate isomerase
MDKLFQRFQSTLTAEINALKKTKAFIRKWNVERCIDHLHFGIDRQGTIYTTGVGKCAPIAEKMADTLSSYGIKSFFMHPSGALHGDLGRVDEDKDIFIMFSKSGTTQEILDLKNALGLWVNVLITANEKSPIVSYDDLLLQIHLDDEGDGLDLAPMASTTAMLAVADGLCAALIEAEGKTRDDFAANHPGGTLGKQLLCTVGDLMETDPDYIPTLELYEDEPIKVLDLLSAFSMSRYGAVFVLKEEKLWGIFTDGDLRRLLKAEGKDFSLLPSTKISHPARTTTKDTLAIDALKMMEQESKITILPVVDKQDQLIGAIHIHDLIKAGIM